MTNSDGREGRYPESHIQDAFLSWFSQATGYVQLYEDAYTQQNTPVDSVGFVDTIPVLIELKARVTKRMVRHENGTEGSLEYKIFRAVRDLYTVPTSAIGAALTAWDRRTPPEIIFVAGAYSPDALVELKQLLAQLGATWRFGARVYQWDGAKGVCLYTLAGPAAIDPAQVVLPEFKPMPAAKRAPKLTAQAVRDLFKARGLEECLDAMLREMDRRGVEIRTRNVSNVNYGKMTLNGSKVLTLVGLWPYDSSVHEGLLVTMDLDAFPECFAVTAVADTAVPGAPAPCKGYLNHQRYLRTPQEVVLFWTALAPVKLVVDLRIASATD